MNNIFKNAYLGKPYKTRDGRKAIYRTHLYSHHLFTEDTQFTCNDEGSVVNTVIPIPELDIISEWQEEISEEELDELAETDANNTVGEWRYGSTDLPKWYGFKEGFKSCYRKLKTYE